MSYSIPDVWLCSEVVVIKPEPIDDDNAKITDDVSKFPSITKTATSIHPSVTDTSACWLALVLSCLNNFKGKGVRIVVKVFFFLFANNR